MTVGPPPQFQSQPVTDEEAFLKRNTDCVYFLASPLTCKKGSECEYRHSDTARMNPTVCYFWLHGNCLNPKCRFRHQLVDGFLGCQLPKPPSQAIPAPVAPCIFFQRGLCLKGNWCPFSHEANAIRNKATASQPVTSKQEAVSEVENETHEKKVPSMDVTKPVELPPPAKSGEPSSGFDVVEDTDDYSSEDDCRVTSNHSERNEYYDDDYSSFSDDGERDRIHTSPGRHAWDPRRAYLGRRLHETDLRHRLLKKRKSNDLNRDENLSLCRDKLVAGNGSRLHRRIKLPPRLRDRIKETKEQETWNDGSYIANRLQGRIKLPPRLKYRMKETGEQETGYFAGPKYLEEELKLGKRKHLLLDGHYPQTGDDLLFEGPKSLEEILKRKRGEIDNNNDEGNNNQKNETENITKIISSVSEGEIVDDDGLDQERQGEIISSDDDGDGAEGITWFD